MPAARSPPRTTRSHLADVAGEEHRGLSGGVAPRRRRPPACRRTSAPRPAWRRSRRRRLRTSASRVDVEPAVARAGREHHGAGAQPLASVELDDVVAVLERERARALGHGAARRRSASPGSRRARRDPRPRCRRGSRGSSRSATTCSPARRSRPSRRAPCSGPPTPRRPPLRAPPGRRRRPRCRTAPRAMRARPEVQRLGDLVVARVAQRERPAQHERGLARRDRQLAQQLVGLRVGLEVQEAVRNPVAGQELAQSAAVRREVRPDEPHARCPARSGARAER